MSHLKVITLYPNQMTTGRRLSPLPQLVCTGGSGRHYASKIRSIQCENKGFDGKEYQWRCEAKLDKSVQFGKFHVSCEGYRDSKDEWILIGSCNLNYQLELRHSPSPPPPPSKRQDVPISQDLKDTQNAVSLIFLLWVLFLLLFCICCCGNDVSSNSQNRHTVPITIPKAIPIHTPRTTIVEKREPLISTTTYNRYDNSSMNYYNTSTNMYLYDDDSSSSDDFGFGGTSNR